MDIPFCGYGDERTLYGGNSVRRVFYLLQYTIIIEADKPVSLRSYVGAVRREQETQKEETKQQKKLK